MKEKILTPEMERKILDQVEDALQKFKEEEFIEGREFLFAFPWMGDEPEPFYCRVSVNRPMRRVPTGPPHDRFSRGYSEYFGRRGWFYWGEEEE